ncbi:MAG: YadA-like family protein [Oxalobacter sp.]|nr:YadA-like family protein [Oxalobacter sp.]
MNQSYKTIFSKVHQCFVVVSELTKSQGKGSRASRVLCSLFLGACLAGVGQPAAWGASASNASVNVTEDSSGNASSAWGKNTTASGNESTAFGVQSEASGNGATAFGRGTTASGDYATAFGDSSEAKAENSLAALGGIVDTAATNSAAIGKGATASVADTVALGSGSVASREAGATDAYLKGSSDTGSAWVSTHNAIAVGNDGTVTRQITGVAAGSKDTDAVNVAQLKAVAAADSNTTYTLKQETAGNQTKIVLTGNDGSPDQTATFEGGTGITITGDSSKATIAVDTVALKAAVDTNTTYQFETKAGDGSDNVVATTTVKSSTDGVNYTETGETFSDTDTKITSVAVDAGTKDASGKTTYTVTLSDNNENKTDSKLKATFDVTDTNTQSTVKHADSSKDYLTVTSADNSIGTKDYTVALTDKANTAIGNASTFLTSSGFSAGGGKVTVTDQGFAVQGGPSMTADGIDAGSKVISNVKAGEKDTDAVNVGQLNATNQKIDSQDNALRKLAHRDAQLERKIYRAGAHAAAIAALHPLDYDEDHKFTAAAGVGQYHGSSAMAVGAFYRPTENLMFSVGASLNENDSMVNAGMAYRFGTGSGNKTSPDNIHEMKRQISTLSEENHQLSAQLNSSEMKLAEESQKRASADAKILTLEDKIRRIEKMLKLK